MPGAYVRVSNAISVIVQAFRPTSNVRALRPRPPPHAKGVVPRLDLGY